MFVHVKDQSSHDNYKLMIGSIVPRPIAFVTSLSEEGTVNAAPFSFFNMVSSEPPRLMFAVQRKPGGAMKDTAHNILLHKEFVVHIVDEDNIAAINHTSINAPSEISEIGLAGLSLVPGEAVKVPRVQECRIAMECKLAQHVDLEGTDMIIGEVVSFYVQDDLVEGGRINIDKLKPVSRLAGAAYSAIGRIFELERPVYEP